MRNDIFIIFRSTAQESPLGALHVTGTIIESRTCGLKSEQLIRPFPSQKMYNVVVEK